MAATRSWCRAAPVSSSAVVGRRISPAANTAELVARSRTVPSSTPRSERTTTRSSRRYAVAARNRPRDAPRPEDTRDSNSDMIPRRLRLGRPLEHEELVHVLVVLFLPELATKVEPQLVDDLDAVVLE